LVEQNLTGFEPFKFKTGVFMTSVFVSATQKYIKGI
ncbi:MAG: hypothetical protein ACI9DQ_000317, partial [Glaciecola sp.]